jgi:hypothetical protein
MTNTQLTKWNQASALAGAFAWAVLAGMAGAGKAPLGVIELLFLFAPLVIVPLGFALGEILSPVQPSGVSMWMFRLQPFAAALVIVSFWISPGKLAGVLVAPWGLLCGTIAAAAALNMLRARRSAFATYIVNFGRIDLAIAGVWLLLSRLGIHTVGIQEPIVLLTGVHFNYTGFTGTLIAGALVSHDARSEKRNLSLKIVVALVTLTPFVVAMGFIWSNTLKMAAALVLSASLVGLAGFQFWFARSLATGAARVFTRLSTIAVALAMGLAAAYAVSDWLKQDWLLIPRMASTHGLLNALGFSLLGILGWLLEFSRPGQRI